MRSLVDMELDAMLAPETVVRAAFQTTAATSLFAMLAGRLPSPDAITNNFVHALVDAGGNRDDLQWAIDAEFIPPVAAVLWEEATK